MDALESDSMQPSNNAKNNTSDFSDTLPSQDDEKNWQSFKYKCKGADDLSKSPPGEYTDDIPIRGFNSISLDKPPYLPPQLLNIVLNKDTSAKVIFLSFSLSLTSLLFFCYSLLKPGNWV